ncbi:MAG: hypothetical protein ABIJ97_01145, partial [Bacteroidota bacterium]
MRKVIYIFIVILMGFGFGISQEIVLNKEDFSSKDDLKAAKDYLKTAEEFYAYGVGGYSRAIDNYLEIQKLNPNIAALNYKIGNCYLNTFQKAKSITYFQKAFELNRNIADDILYKIARGYHLNLEFEKAIEYYTKYRSLLSPKLLSEYKSIIEKRISECNNGIELIKNPVRVFIDNVGPEINSKYPDYSPLISADESMMIFTSRRDDTEGGNRTPEDGEFYEDIYLAYHNGIKWDNSTNIGKPLNTSDHDATVGLSNDGQQLFTYTDKTGGGDIYVSELKGTEWSKPDNSTLKKNINTDFHECAASFSFDGKTMYYITNKPNDNYDTKVYSDPQMRTHDIFYTHWDSEKERWGEPKNIGSTINTEFEEKGVFMHPDGRTLYFSSQGHNTMGDYDIFMSELQDDGTWAKPINIGYPINTPDDDRFFVMAASGKHGYYSTVKDDGHGSYDIYIITFRGPEKPVTQSNEDNLLANIAPVSETIMEETVEIKTMRLTILKGTVKDALTLEPIAADIEIIDNEKNEVISISKSN